MRKIKRIFLLIGVLLILGGIAYLGNYSLKLHQEVQEFISKLRQSPATTTVDFSETLSGLQQNWQKFNLLKNILFSQNRDIEGLLSIIPKIRSDIQLRESFIQTGKDIGAILDGTFLGNLIQGKEDALFYLQDLKENLTKLEKLNLEIISRWESKINGWLEFLGEKEPKHYLVLFQLPEIPRPTGGFLGAYAILNCNQGRIDFQGGHINILDDRFNKMLVPPIAMQRISNRWFFHDLNWFYDVNLSGRKILNYYNTQIKAPVLDGVIFVNAEVIQDILGATGPITLDKYNLIVEQNNFKEFFFNQVEEGLKPPPLRKQPEVLSTFFKKLQLKLKNIPQENLVGVLKSLLDRYSQKDIQVYLLSQILEHKLFPKRETISPEENTLIITWNSISQKLLFNPSTKKLKVQEKIAKDGKVEDTLEIKEEPGVQDRYLKIYLPKGANLISAQNCRLYSLEDNSNFYHDLAYQEDTDLLLQEHQLIKDNKNKVFIFSEEDFTVVECWVNSPHKSVVVKYQLPFSLKKNKWQINIEKQSGQDIYLFYQLLLPAGWKLRPTILPLNKWIPLDRDLKMDFQLEKEN